MFKSKIGPQGLSGLILQNHTKFCNVARFVVYVFANNNVEIIKKRHPFTDVQGSHFHEAAPKLNTIKCTLYMCFYGINILCWNNKGSLCQHYKIVLILVNLAPVSLNECREVD